MLMSINMKVDEILDNFRYIKKGEFPHDALKKAIAQKEAIIPELLAYLKKSPIELINKHRRNRFKSPRGDFMWFFSLFLLAYFREKKAFPLIVKYFKYKISEKLHHPIGDFICNSLPSVIASTFNGDINILLDILKRKEINQYIRASFLKATVIIVMYNRVDEEKMREYHTDLFDNYLETEDVDMMGHWIKAVSNLADPKLRIYIERALHKKMHNNLTFGRDSIEHKYNNPPKKGTRPYSLVTDVYNELEYGGWFIEKIKKIKKIKLKISPEDFFLNKLRPTNVHIPNTQVRDSPKIGRNAPCPCGSGKKYKKCCLNKN